MVSYRRQLKRATESFSNFRTISEGFLLLISGFFSTWCMWIFNRISTDNLMVGILMWVNSDFLVLRFGPEWKLFAKEFLFFAVYVIYKKNYSFSRVVFFQTKIANSFYSKINDSGSLRTTRFSSSRFGVRVTALPKIFTIYPQHFSIPETSGTLRCSYEKLRHCETKSFRRKIVNPPFSYP